MLGSVDLSSRGSNGDNGAERKGGRRDVEADEEQKQLRGFFLPIYNGLKA